MNANPLSAKLTKLLASSLDDPKLRTSLAALSEFYTVNAVNSRHNLRGDIERRGTEVNYQLLRELEKVNIVKHILFFILLFSTYHKGVYQRGGGHHLTRLINSSSNPSDLLDMDAIAIPGTGGRDERNELTLSGDAGPSELGE